MNCLASLFKVNEPILTLLHPHYKRIYRKEQKKLNKNNKIKHSPKEMYNVQLSNSIYVQRGYVLFLIRKEPITIEASLEINRERQLVCECLLCRSVFDWDRGLLDISMFSFRSIDAEMAGCGEIRANASDVHVVWQKPTSTERSEVTIGMLSCLIAIVALKC